MKSGVAAIVAAALGWASPVHAAACDEAKLASLDRGLTEMPGDLHLSVAGAGLVEACRLAPALDKAFRKVLMTGEDSFARLAGASVAQGDPALFLSACPGGPRVMADAARRFGDPRVGPREEALAWWDGCRVERFAVATREEWSRAGAGALLAIVTAQWLRETAKLSPARVRTYTRALAGLDAPAKRTLADRYPDDGLGVAGGRAAGAAAIEVALSDFEGASDVADEYVATLRTERARLADCFAAPAAPKALSMRLTIADGAAQEGELVRISKSGSTTRIDHLDADPRLERCLLARVARIRFKTLAAPTKIYVAVTRGTQPALAPDGVAGGVAGGVEGGAGKRKR